MVTKPILVFRVNSNMNNKLMDETFLTHRFILVYCIKIRSSKDVRKATDRKKKKSVGKFKTFVIFPRERGVTYNFEYLKMNLQIFS